LKLNDETKLSTITHKSRAFCLDPSRLYIHLRDKYSRGSVEKADYSRIMDEICQGIKELSYNGEKIIEGIYLKEEIFDGPYSETGPDIYILPRHGFDLKASLKSNVLFGKTHFNGMHTYDDAHFYISGEKHWDREDIDISSIATIIKNYFVEE